MNYGDTDCYDHFISFEGGQIQVSYAGTSTPVYLYGVWNMVGEPVLFRRIYAYDTEETYGLWALAYSECHSVVRYA